MANKSDKQLGASTVYARVNSGWTVEQSNDQWMGSATETATSSALSLLQLGQAADVLGVSPIAVPALSAARIYSVAMTT